MKFFDREDKIEKLRAIRERSATKAQFTVITGRRRVGKTMLVKHAFGVASFAVFSGKALEDYFACKLVESGEWSKVGNWWDRKGENEIDLIAENELDGATLVAEVKRDRKRIDLAALKDKFEAFAKATGRRKDGSPQFMALSLEDM